MNGKAGEWETHRRDAEVENVQFLMDVGGLQFADACKRAGVSPSAVEGRVRRKAS